MAYPSQPPPGSPYDQPTQVQPMPQRPGRNWKLWAVIGAICVVVGAATVAWEFHVYQRGAEQRELQQAKDQLVAACRAEVRTRRSGRTEFPVWDQVSLLSGATDGTVYGEVTAPNSSGVMASQKYTCSMAKIDGGWTVTSLTFR
jgi:hypothetical protein